MDRSIEVKVNGSYLTKDNDLAGIQHEANVTRLRITFDEGWDGFAKKVTWWDAYGQNPVERTLTADLLEDITKSTGTYLVPIPGEPLAVAGRCTFVIDGYADGRRQRSLSDTLKVRAADFARQAEQPADPTPTQAEQLQVQIDTMLDDMQERAVRAKTSELNAAASEMYAEECAEQARQSAILAERGAEAATSVRNMTVSGVSVPPDSKTPVVEKEFNEDGSLNLHFNTRQGVSGVFVGGGEMPEGFNLQVDYEEGCDAPDIYGLVEEAERWANAAQTYAEQATVPAVAGVYNVVLTDRITGGRYALLVERGRLRLLGVSDKAEATELTLIDSDTGVSFAVVVDSGKLILEEV